MIRGRRSGSRLRRFQSKQLVDLVAQRTLLGGSLQSLRAEPRLVRSERGIRVALSERLELRVDANDPLEELVQRRLHDGLTRVLEDAEDRTHVLGT